eukprot:TRINITY_DN31322_c0_g1_i2.p1 TRINITY_DN31322_c0_g1~~TRINITY_DN31322_c0_g1_i2.p1  ORF type:complete len:270 (+),score=30.36 TRINITY_DN31322_c0_g1_i2:94-903(+)
MARNSSMLLTALMLTILLRSALWSHQTFAGIVRNDAAPSRQLSKRDAVGSGVLVSVEIEPDRVPAFLAAMKDDVTKSRDAQLDPGCLRFDLLRDKVNPNKFVFYECYVDDAAVAHHKTTSHYKSWADFKSQGGVVSQFVRKVETTSLPAWAFQSESCEHDATGHAVLVSVDIEKERIPAFLQAMEDDVVNSRNAALDPGCVRFDLLRDRDNPNTFIFYEVYKDNEAAAFHKTTSHYRSWAEFKANGGADNQEVVQLDSASIDGGWAFQV